MDDRKFCEKHQKWYWPNQAWIHSKCGTDARTGKRSSGNQDNKPEKSAKESGGQGLDSVSSEDGNSRAGPQKQRWSRQAYNEYMKDYMRKRRKEKL